MVIKAEGGEEINNLLVSDENSEYAATISELPLAQTYNMAFFNYSADTTTITFNRRLKNTHYIAQSGYYLYPSSYGGSKDPFHDTYFIHNTCGKTGASSSSTISRYGCAVCSEAMIAMYKGNFSNSGTYDVYNIVKEVATKGTSNTFDYDRRDYVIEYAGRQIAIYAMLLMYVNQSKFPLLLKTGLSSLVQWENKNLKLERKLRPCSDWWVYAAQKIPDENGHSGFRVDLFSFLNSKFRPLFNNKKDILLF